MGMLSLLPLIQSAHSLLELRTDLSNLTLNPQLLQILKEMLLLVLVLNTKRLLRIQPRMSLLSSTPHGAVIAKSLPQSGMSLVKPTRINQILSLLNSMPPLMKLKELRSEDTQLLNGSQDLTKKENPTKVREISQLSKSSLKRTLKFSRKPLQVVPNKRSSDYREFIFNLIAKII